MLATLVACSSTPADAPWPTQVVKIEQMRMLSPLRLSLPEIPRKGKLRGPTVLQVHVGTDGSVRRTRLFESSGSSDHDEAAIHAMRATHFRPHTFGGVPEEVTLVVPFHWPKSKDIDGN